jgi:hypothetical protein
VPVEKEDWWDDLHSLPEEPKEKPEKDSSCETGPST